MPWSGGVYTRGYPSWTNDANNNLPISATKFDTEDNDFAAGLNNCLTKDGLSQPTAAMNWNGQDLTNVGQLTAKGVNVTNSPIPANGIYLPSANTLGFSSNSAARGSINSAGNWSIAAPTSGIALAINGLSGAAASLQLIPSGASDMAMLISGTTTGQAAIEFDFNTAAKAYFGVSGTAGQLISGSIAGDLNVRTQGGNFLVSTDGGAHVVFKASASNGAVMSSDGTTLFELGWRDIPQTTFSTATTLAATFRGKSVRTSTGINLTLPTVASVGVGAAILVFNSDTNNTNLLAQGGDTLVLAGTSTTGSRVVAQNGIAFCYAGVAGFWYISGPGVS